MYGKALAALLLLQAGGLALAQHADEDMEESASMPVSKSAFVNKAAADGMAEVVLARLALQRTQDPQMREFAQRMVKDHTEANARLETAAAQEGMRLPTDLDPEHEQVLQKLKGLQGAAFEREYSKHMEEDHDKAVALFKSATQNPELGEPIRQFAANTLPALQEHQRMAEQLARNHRNAGRD